MEHVELLNKQRVMKDHYILVQVETSSNQRACGEPELQLQSFDAFSTLGVCHGEADTEMKQCWRRMKERGVGEIMKNKERWGSGTDTDRDKGQMGSSRLQLQHSHPQRASV